MNTISHPPLVSVCPTQLPRYSIMKVFPLHSKCYGTVISPTLPFVKYDFMTKTQIWGDFSLVFIIIYRQQSSWKLLPSHSNIFSDDRSQLYTVYYHTGWGAIKCMVTHNHIEILSSGYIVSWLNSLAPGKFEWNFQIDFSDWCLRYLL